MKNTMCPHCSADLLGEVIPEHIREHDPSCGERYHRALEIEIQGVHDGVLFTACPECYRTWHHWDPERSPRLWEAAERHRARFTAMMNEPVPPSDEPC